MGPSCHNRAGADCVGRRLCRRRPLGGPVGREAAEAQPPAPLFFVSYARSRARGRASGPPGDRQVRQFFATVSEHLAQLVPLPPGVEPGFMDAGVDDGGRWSAALLRAVGTSQSFIALLSPAYVASERCAMEWDAFAHRVIISRKRTIARMARPRSSRCCGHRSLSGRTSSSELSRIHPEGSVTTESLSRTVRKACTAF